MKEFPRYARRYMPDPECFSSEGLPIRKNTDNRSLISTLRAEGVITRNGLSPENLKDLLGRTPKRTAKELGISLRETDTSAKDVKNAVIGRVIYEHRDFFVSIYPETAITIDLMNNGPKMTLKTSETITLAIIQLVNGRIDRWNQINETVRNAGIRINLNGLFIPNMFIQDADFSGTDMIKAVLTGCKLRGAEFEGTDVTGTNIQGVEISGKWHPLFKMMGVDTSGAIWV